jgi:hypothetical protein
MVISTTAKSTVEKKSLLDEVLSLNCCRSYIATRMNQIESFTQNAMQQVV